MPARIPDVVAALQARARPDGAARLARYGIVGSLPVLGLPVDEVRAVAKAAGRDQALAELL